MADKSCCSCKYSIYEVNETDDGNYIVCTKGNDVTEEMLLDSPCDEYIRVKLNMNQINKVASRDGSQSLTRK